MTPTQLTVVVELIASFGHTLDGLGRWGIRLAADPSVIEEIQQCDHPHAASVADRILPLPAARDEDQ